MRQFTLVFAFITAALAVPFSLPNGFPNLPSGQHLLAIESQAGGPLPNLPLPTDLKPDEIMTLQVIAATEIFEVAYFSTLLEKVEKAEAGFTIFGAGQDSAQVITNLKQIVAQEQLHAFAANLAIAASGGKTIGACRYKFPASSYVEAIDIADTFTSLVLGVLPQVQKAFALEGGSGVNLIPILGSILGQEGEQVGAYRLTAKKVPSAAPFLTGASGIFAYNAIRSFIVDGSCPPTSNVSAIALPVLKGLNLVGAKAVKPVDQILQFSSPYTGKASHIVYLSGQNAPTIVPILSAKIGKVTSTFKAKFPFISSSFSKGLTVASLVTIDNLGNASVPIAPDQIALVSVAGPALIKVD